MLRGEFESMRAIAKVVPTFVPTPIAWGTYAAHPSIHFFLCAFQDLSDDSLDIAKFCEKVAQMHLKSVSPTGQYGFHVTTHHGNLPQNNKWNDSWESFFAEGLKSMFELEEQTQGTSSAIEELRGPLFGKVIPRLLRPLETGGRKIKPSLIHGDLWYGNASTDLDLDEPMVYDACSFYAHNEYELGSWRPARNKFSKAFNKAYHRHFHIADPVEDYDDRVALYSVYVVNLTSRGPSSYADGSI